jgi:teichuronic acid biosynthesis glycosyltransferase TuaC
MRVLAVTNIFPTIHAPTSGTYVEQQIQSLRHIGLKVEVLIVDRSRNGWLAYLGLKRRVQDRAAEFCPDLIHLMYGGVMADVVTRQVMDCPVVVSFCGSDLMGEELAGPIRKLLSSCGVLASRRAARRAAAVIVKSGNLLQALPSDVRTNPKSAVIPNGVNLDRFKPLDRMEARRALNWDGNRFHILFASATGDGIKRPDLARAAVRRLQQSGIDSALHILSKIPHQEMPLHLNASDAVLLTSFREGSPNIVKEALACNIPVVSVDVGDVKDRIGAIDGCYVADPDPHSLASMLAKVHTGPRRVEGRRRMESFSLPTIARQIVDIYELALGKTARLKTGEPAD